MSAALVCFGALSGQAAQAAHTQARLVLAAEAARPGDTVLAGVHLRMDPRWHTYWRNAGASAAPTKIEWQLPAGVTAGEIQWPVPEKLPADDLTAYIYENDVVLLVPLKLAPDVPPGALELKAKVSWIECEALCVPGDATVRATLTVGTDTKPSKDAGLISEWQKKLPQSGAGLSARAWWEKAATGDTRPLILEWSSTAAAAEADFYPDAGEQFEVNPITQKVPAESGRLRLRAQVKKLQGDWPQHVSGLLIQKSGAQRLAYDVNLPVEASGPSLAAAPPLGRTLLKLLYAFLGGLILNVMPCVLPVIALKILGFVAQAKDEPRQIRRLGLIYGLGVVVSFLVMAALVIGVKAAGRQAGWGMQFGNPQFVVLLTVLVTLVALNLFGLFEVTLGSGVIGTAGALASKKGPAGAFFNGVLATPCTAPFLSSGLGFAFKQSDGIILLVFATAGLGLAAPYVVLSWNPAWLKFLPKPGPWMEKFKIAMGFPMLATAFWLFSLIPLHYGDRSWWLGMFLVILALAAWVFGEFVQRGRSRRGVATVVALALLLGGYFGVVEGRLHWRSPPEAGAADSGLAKNEAGIAWQPWSPQAVAAARAEGRPVLVDFTASWCLTCNTVVKPALDSRAIRDKLQEIGGVALLADYSGGAAHITDELNRLEHPGVPLLLVYPKNPSQAPIVLRDPTPFEPPSHYRSLVLEALGRATREVARQ